VRELCAPFDAVALDWFTLMKAKLTP